MKLSKSKIISSRQCQKKLWLEVHKPELIEFNSSSQTAFSIGDKVGDIARNIYDPNLSGTLIDPFDIGFDKAFKQTQKLLTDKKSIFEAAFSNDYGLVLADVLCRENENSLWRMIEIKSSTSVKDYYLDDIAIQYHIASSSGLKLESISLGHIDNSWIYKGDGDYRGLITEVDLTSHAINAEEEVINWFDQGHKTIKQETEPAIETSEHCFSPFECPFLEHCSKDKPKASFPVNWLPNIRTKKLKSYIANNEVIELSGVPDELLNDKQLLVKKHTLENKIFFDHEGSSRELDNYDYPYYFLDFETINPAVPKWSGTRAYQMIPFQFSLHVHRNANSDLEHFEFLDLSGEDPSLKFAQTLIKDCDKQGPIFVYNIGFESARIKELGARYPELEPELLAINKRLIDLWPIAKKHYYHPSQQGSWSIKKVLPAMVPHLNYDDLEGVQDGGMAMDAFEIAISIDTSKEDKDKLKAQLLKYCELDTFAMVEIFRFFKNS